jgi:hypothetical protein
MIVRFGNVTSVPKASPGMRDGDASGPATAAACETWAGAEPEPSDAAMVTIRKATESRNGIALLRPSRPQNSGSGMNGSLARPLANRRPFAI